MFQSTYPTKVNDHLNISFLNSTVSQDKRVNKKQDESHKQPDKISTMSFQKGLIEIALSILYRT